MDKHSEDPDSNLPLHDEAVAREKWRGRESRLSGKEEGHDLPPGEADATGGRANGGEQDDDHPGHGRPGAFPPPD